MRLHNCGWHSWEGQGSLWNTGLLIPHPLLLLVSLLITSVLPAHRETLESTGECEEGRRDFHLAAFFYLELPTIPAENLQSTKM